MKFFIFILFAYIIVSSFEMSNNRTEHIQGEFAMTKHISNHMKSNVNVINKNKGKDNSIESRKKETSVNKIKRHINQQSIRSSTEKKKRLNHNYIFLQDEKNFTIFYIKENGLSIIKSMPIESPYIGKMQDGSYKVYDKYLDKVFEIYSVYPENMRKPWIMEVPYKGEMNVYNQEIFIKWISAENSEEATRLLAQFQNTETSLPGIETPS